MSWSRLKRISLCCAAVAMLASATRGQSQTSPLAPIVWPSGAALTLEPQPATPPPPESIYAPPEPPAENQGVNEGGVHLDLTVRYLTDYVYRGIDRSEVGGSEDRPNVQFDGKLNFDLGKLPHPFVALFVNVYNADPISRFQEVRPAVGFDWPIKPFTFSAGNITYIYPEREELNTSEIFVQAQLDDAFLWSTERPILSPYIYAAYDYDLYNGWYLEVGVKHDFVFEETGLTITAVADAAYVFNQGLFLMRGTTDTGFQHYDIGLIGSYSLNTLLNFPKRFGEFSVQGYVYYTDGIDSDLRADTQIWGGAGMNFKY